MRSIFTSIKSLHGIGLICLLFVVLVSSGVMTAAEFSPGLEEILLNADPNDIISVIMHLEHVDEIDIRQLDQNLHEIDPPVELSERHEQIIIALQYNAGLIQPTIEAMLDIAQSQGNVQQYASYWVDNLVTLKAKASYIEIFRTTEGISLVTENAGYEYYLPPEPGALDTGVEDNIIGGVSLAVTSVNGDVAWQLVGRGSGQIIGILEGVPLVTGGIPYDHDAIRDRWRGLHAPLNECWLDVWSEFDFPPGAQTPGGHALKVTSVACGEFELGNETVTLGIAPEAEWISTNAAYQNSSVLPEGNIPQLIQAYQWFADPDGDPYTINDVPCAVNCSWHIGLSSEFLCQNYLGEVISNLEACGPVVVFAAGNEGVVNNPQCLVSENSSTWDIDNFAVGGVNASQGTSAPYDLCGNSARGPVNCFEDEPFVKPNLVAPGCTIPMAEGTGTDYAAYSGTSFAAPLVAGTIALMRAACPECDAITIKEKLIETAVKEGYEDDQGEESPNNKFGHGMLDANAAVQACLGEPRDCANPVELVNGKIFRGHTEAIGASNFDLWEIPSGVPSVVAAQRSEVVHQIEIETTSSLTVHLSDLSPYDESDPDHRLVILLTTNCDNLHCTASAIADESGNAVITAVDLAPNFYDIVVDGQEGGLANLAGSPYTLLACVGDVATPVPAVSYPPCENTETTICWNFSGYYDQFLVEIDDDLDDGWSYPQIQAYSTCYSLTLEGNPGDEWNWRVKAIDQCSQSEWSDWQSVTIEAYAALPPPLSPPDNAHACLDHSVLYSWNDDLTAPPYELQFTQDETFETVNFSRTDIQNPTESVALTALGDWYWRVLPEDPCVEEGLAEIRHVTVEFVPEVPSLISPETAAIRCAGVPIEFCWDLSQGATAYTIEFQHESDQPFEVPDLTQTCNMYPLNELGTWTWRVKAVNDYCESAYSASRTIIMEVPPAPTLLGPVDWSPVCVGADHIYSWNPVPGATGYRIEFNELYTQEVFDPGIVYSQSPAELALPSPGEWYWFVRATYDGCNYGPYSLPNVVVTVDGPTIIGPPDFLMICPEDPTAYSWNAVSYSSGYSIEFDNFADQHDPVQSQIFSPATTEVNLALADVVTEWTPDPGEWYWRVHTWGIDNCTEASQWNVVTVPSLTTPQHQVTGNPVCLHAEHTYSWDPVAEASYYDIEFNTGMFTFQRNSTTNSVNYQLPFDGHWSWRVRSKFGSCASGWTRWATILTDPGPGVPSHLTPEDNETVVRNEDQLYTWSAETGANGYLVEWSSSSSFEPAAILYQLSPLNNNTTVALDLEPQLIYWRVTAVNSNGCYGEPSHPQYFNLVNPLPGAVTLISPATYEQIFIGVPVEWQWSAVPYTDQYRLQWDGTGEFSQYDELIVDGAQSSVLWPFNGAGTWYWRMRAENGSGNGPWSETRKGDVINPPLPGDVSLDTPVHGQDVDLNESYPYCVVTEPLASHYNFQWDLDDTFTNPPHEAQVMAAEDCVPMSLETAETWFWRAQAINITGASAWTEARKVLVVMPGSPLSMPDSDDLRIPESEVANVCWSTVPGATKYRIELSGTAGFKNVKQEIVTQENCISLAARKGEKQYFRVCAEIDGKSGKWSEVKDLQAAKSDFIQIEDEQFKTASGGLNALSIQSDASLGVPAEFRLYQNHPNPFNPTTQIRYDLPENARVQINVYNTLGQLVANLRDQVQPAGRYTLTWSGKSATSTDVATGMYIYQIKADNFTDTKKMLLLK